jgi:predicted ABC-type ATPase
VGGPCSGKDKIIKTLKEDIPNEIDILSLAKAKTIHEQVIINGSANELNEILSSKKLLESNGYHTSLVFVDVSNDISKLRNEERQTRGQRVISENIRFSKYVSSQENKTQLKEQFGEDMTIKDNSLDERFNSFLKEEGKEQKSKPKDREEGTNSLRKIYTATTPGQTKKDEPGGGGAEVGGVGVGPTATGGSPGIPFGMAESIKNWMNNPKTQTRFAEKYGNLAEKKLFEAAYSLNKSLTKQKPKK